MPESPEVQILAEFLAGRLVGHEIGAVQLLDRRALTTRPESFEQLAGRHIAAVIRWGKHIDLDAGEHHLVISLGRHGWARWFDELPEAEAEAAGAEAQPKIVARIRMADGSGFELTDAGGWSSVNLSVVPDARKLARIAGLGPDPADATFTRGDFERALGGRRKLLKALLQEQQSLAGIGNAYSDEILHAARLPPTMRASDLDAEQTERLFEATRGVIRDAIEQRRGTLIAHLKAAKVAAMQVHGRTGSACPVCVTTVQDVSGSDGTAQFCPTCQSESTGTASDLLHGLDR